MNRAYDPTLGRFLSADPIVPYPDASQSLNRYSYVHNNPLSFTDPSGHFPNPFKAAKKAFKSIGNAVASAGRWLGNNWRTVVSVAATTIGWAAGGVPGAFIGGFTSGMIVSGGDVRVGLMSAASAAAFAWIGGTQAFSPFAIGRFNYGKVFAHGVVGGAFQEVQGGRFAEGFLSAGFTQTVAQTGAFEHLGSGDTWGSRLAQTGAAATVGGTASVIGGGKFQNGAVTAAFSYAFNDAMHRAGERQLDKYGRALTADEKAVYTYTGSRDHTCSAVLQGHVVRWLRLEFEERLP